ncbi:Serine/threonine-protein phosphatase 6 regulatory subunit 3-A [Tetrabaena socialis]|uniref:Serine/threonine-protein phosphatase 6 regulatory subunit 3-A n=1 Tax=Tetrabaena socialis TaxID=47790 RepID=A0A2J8A6B4_9CHLO|nr:Serine/threonine-protein phosphatase 6 regulatory subunit 3-A [Tetrabaena socialis]|eukprot:PNH08035.1 Serine/threonine-protein phosphatase 6 regulatory subunit 3-A [Tetrabaena socialis]
MFWKVTGFSQPSPVEVCATPGPAACLDGTAWERLTGLWGTLAQQILDKEEFTLEELLEEDDIVQECKSLNGRLVAFLRERSTVEQLIKYIVEPPGELDDPKRTYKYPFTSCEVFCCEVEAVFNTLLEDPDLMRLLFSLLDSEPPLSCKTAGYFGRVVSHLLLRKTNEMMQYFQENPHILEKLVNHVDTTSVTEIVKRLVGADEQSSIMFMPTYAQWLADTSLVNLLLNRLGSSHSVEVQTNAADILSAIAHTQPSPLAAKLTREECIGALFQHALQPGRQVLVAALDVCIALLEPKRSNPELLTEGSPLQESARRAKSEAVVAIVNHLPSLVGLLQLQDGAATLDTPYGLLTPPLGRAKLKVVELMAVLLRSGDVVAERGLVASNSVPVCLDLFRAYPFNNLLHHNVTAMLVAGLARPSEGLIPYLFEDCKVLDWITTLATEVRPTPRPGFESMAAAKPALRAGYLGHVIQIGSTLEGVASAGVSAQESVNKAAVEGYLTAHAGWQLWLASELHPRQDVENISKWQCGRPAATDLAGIDSDGDEYQNDMDLGEIQGMQPALYHRYNVVDEGDEDDDDEEEEAGYKGTSMFGEAGGPGGVGGDRMAGDADAANADLTEALNSMNLRDRDHGDAAPMEEAEASTSHGQGGRLGDGPSGQDVNIDDDEVLLATSDDDEPGLRNGSGGGATEATDDPGTQATDPASAAGTSSTDMVMEDEEAAGDGMGPVPAAPAVAGAGEAFGTEGGGWKPNWPESVGTS